MPGSGRPAIIAGRSGPAAAASRNTLPTVDSLMGTDVSAGQYDVVKTVTASSLLVPIVCIVSRAAGHHAAQDSCRDRETADRRAQPHGRRARLADSVSPLGAQGG